MNVNEQIKQMPKIVLHLHLDGSLRPETVYQWLRQGAENETPLEEVKKALEVNDGCRDLNEYLEKFALPVEVLQTTENIKRATIELFEDLAKQNVIYAEVRFAPSLHTRNGLNYDEIVQSAITGMRQAERKHNIKGNLILCCMRGDNEENNLNTVKMAKKHLNNGVCAIDLAGAEALYPTAEYEELFKIAKGLNIPFTIHAGEADGPESVKRALKFGAKRIGHGVRSIEDAELIEELKKQEVILEVCPTSNLQTQAVEGKHPLEDLYKKGISISINTDNNTVSNTDIIKEYEWVLANTNLTIKDLEKCNENAIKGAFIMPQEKVILLSKIHAFKDKNRIGERE